VEVEIDIEIVSDIGNKMIIFDVSFVARACPSMSGSG
jgi:hypothetical protein